MAIERRVLPRILKMLWERGYFSVNSFKDKSLCSVKGWGSDWCWGLADSEDLFLFYKVLIKLLFPCLCKRTEKSFSALNFAWTFLGVVVPQSVEDWNGSWMVWGLSPSCRPKIRKYVGRRRGIKIFSAAREWSTERLQCSDCVRVCVWARLRACVRMRVFVFLCVLNIL